MGLLRRRAGTDRRRGAAADARAGLQHRRPPDAVRPAAASAWTSSPPRSRSSAAGCSSSPTPGRGARFTIRLPFTLAITQALIVRVHDELFALPLADRRGRGAPAALRDRAAPRRGRGRRSTTAADTTASSTSAASSAAGRRILPETDVALPVMLVRAGEHSTALVTDELVGSREIVVKSVGPQIAGIRGISGATILGDGRIVIILDMGALVRSEWRARAAEAAARSVRDDRIFALVVDDSITVRRVTQRLLERNGMRVLTAKDGVEAHGAAAGARARHHPARHRDAAHGRLRGRRARAQRRAPGRRADHHDHLARRATSTAPAPSSSAWTTTSASRTRKASCSTRSSRWCCAPATRAAGSEQDSAPMARHAADRRNSTACWCRSPTTGCCCRAPASPK